MTFVDTPSPPCDRIQLPMDNQTLASKDDDKENENEKDVVSYRGSIAERRAAKCGFNVERIIAARFPATSPPPAVAQSPCVTISPGISPTALFDSPFMLPNSQVSSPSDLAQKADVDYQALFTTDLPIDFEFSAEFPKGNAGKTCAIDPIDDVKVSSCMNVNDSFGNLQRHTPDRNSEPTSLHKEPICGEDVEAQNVLEGDQLGKKPRLEMIRTSEDEYNWRKYGQKQVKGSEYPRSYYKCTHPICQVKKNVERSLDGEITKIIYKGVHNHPKPQPSCRPALGPSFSFNEMLETRGGGGVSVKVKGGLVWRNTLAGLMDVKLGSNSLADGLEIASSTSVVPELSDPSSTTYGKPIGTFESSETLELSSTLPSHDDNDNGVTLGSISPDDDVDDDDKSQSKRRKMEGSLLEANLASRAVREPRVVVQIESEVDILDDGYRWRKYGQKVVKGNPNPRSYYKCTSAGCTVRKHVERASHNLKFVITTYEGKHNHEVPAARNSGHVNSSGVSLLPAAADALSALTLPRNNYTSKTEPQIQDVDPYFDRKPELNNGYLRPTFVGNLNNEMKYGVPSLYLMKFPPLQNPYGSLGLNANPPVNQSASVDSIIHDFQISFPWSLPTSADLLLAGFDFSNNDGKSMRQV